MPIVHNPHNIDLRGLEAVSRKFEADQPTDELEAEIKMQLGAEETILNCEGKTIVAYQAGLHFDDFAQNKITVMFYYLQAW